MEKKNKKLKNKLFIILSTVVCFSILCGPIIRPKAYIVDEFPVEGIFSFDEVYIGGEESFVIYDLSNPMPGYLDINDAIPEAYTIEYENYPSAVPNPPLLASLQFRSTLWTDYDFEFINENYPYTLSQYESNLYIQPYSDNNELVLVELRYNDFVFMPVTNRYGDSALELALIEDRPSSVGSAPLQVSFYGTFNYTNTEGQRATMEIDHAIHLTSQDEYVYFDFYPSDALVLDGYPSPVLVSDLVVRFGYVLYNMDYFEIILLSYAYTELEDGIYDNQQFSTVYNLPDYVPLYDSKTFITPGIGDLLMSISQSVVDFLKIELFPNFAFYHILIIALAIPLLVAILKLYLGG